MSAVTILALYEERVIFGVLTFLGAAMLVTGGLERLFNRKNGEQRRDRTGPENAVLRSFAGLAACLLLFHVTRWINIGYLRIGPWLRLDLPDWLYTIGSGLFFLFSLDLSVPGRTVPAPGTASPKSRCGHFCDGKGLWRSGRKGRKQGSRDA